MTALKASVSKLTIQAVLAAALVFTACAGFLIGKIDGPTFIALAILPAAWAFRQNP